jgi:hypothetical protein
MKTQSVHYLVFSIKQPQKSVKLNDLWVRLLICCSKLLIYLKDYFMAVNYAAFYGFCEEKISIFLKNLQMKLKVGLRLVFLKINHFLGACTINLLL